MVALMLLYTQGSAGWSNGWAGKETLDCEEGYQARVQVTRDWTRWKSLQVKSEGERLYCATVRHLLPWERTSTASPSLRSGSRDLATDPL